MDEQTIEQFISMTGGMDPTQFIVGSKIVKIQRHGDSANSPKISSWIYA